ncbi:MAG: hypothetical protein NE327_21075 [Lentisphaeraceae bacterium]|nr:hypothetical protein [Lentisphaeraceae bacterium]
MNSAKVMTSVEKITEKIRECNEILQKNNFTSINIDNAIFMMNPRLHLTSDKFLSIFDEFCYEFQSDYLQVNLRTVVNNVEVFCLVEPSCLGLQVKMVEVDL